MYCIVVIYLPTATLIIVDVTHFVFVAIFFVAVRHCSFITFDDLVDILGNGTENDALEKIWIESLEECKAHLDRITFEDFKRLMKGQPKEIVVGSSLGSFASPSEPSSLRGLSTVPEGMLPVVPSDAALEDLDLSSGLFQDDEIENPRLFYGKGRSLSYEQTGGSWDADDSREFNKDSSLAVLLQSHPSGAFDEIDASMTPLTANRVLYRKHREMRLAVLDASKQFDKKRDDIQSRNHLTRAGLIMKRGSKPPVEVEDAHARALFDSAAKRCGRFSKQQKHTRNKTVSDLTLLMAKNN